MCSRGVSREMPLGYFSRRRKDLRGLAFGKQKRKDDYEKNPLDLIHGADAGGDRMQ